jgi:hypothetical protein
MPKPRCIVSMHARFWYFSVHLSTFSQLHGIVSLSRILEITCSEREENGRCMWIKKEMILTRISDGENGEDE